VHTNVHVLGKPVSSYIDNASKNSERNRCIKRYKIGDELDITLCSDVSLSQPYIDEITNQYEVSKALYHDFVKSKITAMPSRTSLVPTIFVTSVERLNDSEIFPKKGKAGTVVGWYIGKNCGIYVTEAIFTESGKTDLPHEVAHWLNHVSGVSDKGSEEDERIAREFENYYLKNKF